MEQAPPPPGGLSLALDGLTPQADEPPIGVIRGLSSSLTLRSGWLAQQDQPPVEAFLKPLKHLEWPILTVLSDQQTGLWPALATMLPQSRQPWGHVQYLRHLAAPLAETEAAFKGEGRQAVQQHVGDRMRQAPRADPNPAGVLIVTGLLPTPIDSSKTSATAPQHPRLKPMREACNSFVTPATCSRSKADRPVAWQGGRPTTGSTTWPALGSSC